MNVAMILSLAGGLGLFLYGMQLMSEGIEKAAGAKLRSILEFVTNNKFMGMIVGIVFTGIVQSSSACTVMVVSFVNAGLMNLYQAAGVIFGANIGTTVTSQLVSFNLSAYAPVFLLIGVLLALFSKNQKIVKIADVIVGFGVLFMGLNGMSNAMSGMREEPAIVNALSSLTNPEIGILVGIIITFIIQSSSVTVSIVLLMCQQGLLSLEICLFIILGCNIGSCGSALIASLAGKKDAKRAAMIHFLFNVFGSIVMWIGIRLGTDSVVNFLHRISGEDLGRCIANAHTLIKVGQVILLLPFSNLLVKLTYMIIRGEDEKIEDQENFQTQYIGNKVVFNPATAVVDAIRELERMADLAGENLNRAMRALVTLNDKDIEEVYKVEQNINFLNKAISAYLVKISQTTLPIEDMKSIGGLFHIANDIERIGDHAENIADNARRRKENGSIFSKDAQNEMNDMLIMVNQIIEYSIEMFDKGSEEHLQDILLLEDEVDKKERELQQKHVDRLKRQECTPEAGMLFSDVVSGLERVADHATNIAFSILSGDPAGNPEQIQ